MRRLVITALAIGSLTCTAAPATAATAASGGPSNAGTTGGIAAEATASAGWEPAPSEPWEVAAGERCDFAISGVPVVDEVRKLTVQSYPDGTARREIYTGDLVVRITNLDTGASADADVSGDAVMEFRPDGSMSRWYVRGPVLVGMGADAGNLPRGMWVVDGLFTIDFTTDGQKNITMVHGTQRDMCAEIA